MIGIGDIDVSEIECASGGQVAGICGRVVGCGFSSFIQRRCLCCGRDFGRIIGASDRYGHGLDQREDAVVDLDVEGQRDDFACGEEIDGIIADKIGPVDRATRGRGRLNRDAAGRIQAETGQQCVELRRCQRTAIVECLRHNGARGHFGITGFTEIRIKEGDRAGGGYRICIDAARVVSRFNDSTSAIATRQRGLDVACILVDSSACSAIPITRRVTQQAQRLHSVAGDRGSA